MQSENMESSAVTALSVIGFVFGLIGMLGSFIPCLGGLAFYIGMPATLISALGLFIAYSLKSKKTFAVVALTISLLGVAISGYQYYSIKAMGQKAQKELQIMTAPKPIAETEDDVIPAKVYSPTSKHKSSVKK